MRDEEDCGSYRGIPSGSISGFDFMSTASEAEVPKNPGSLLSDVTCCHIGGFQKKFDRFHPDRGVHEIGPNINSPMTEGTPCLIFYSLAAMISRVQGTHECVKDLWHVFCTRIHETTEPWLRETRGGGKRRELLAHSSFISRTYELKLVIFNVTFRHRHYP